MRNSLICIVFAALFATSPTFAESVTVDCQEKSPVVIVEMPKAPDGTILSYLDPVISAARCEEGEGRVILRLGDDIHATFASMKVAKDFITWLARRDIETKDAALAVSISDQRVSTGTPIVDALNN